MSISLNINNNKMTEDSKYTCYQIENEIGYGAFGRVFLSILDNKKLAIKQIKCNDTDIIARAKRISSVLYEFKIGNTFSEQHPCIVPIIDVFIKDKQLINSKIDSIKYMLVMPFFQTNLSKLLKYKIISLDHISWIFYQIMSGVKFIHSANIVHFDLKPANIFLNSDMEIGSVVIGDLGSCCICDDELPSDYMATRWYRPPEIPLNDKIYGKGVDIWSCGCILAEMITRKPFLPGFDYHDQLKVIFSTMGSLPVNCIKKIKNKEALDWYMKECHGFTKKNLYSLISTYRPKSDSKDEIQEAINIIDAMLNLDPRKRISAKLCFKMPFIKKYADSDAVGCNPPHKISFTGKLPINHSYEIGCENLNRIIEDESYRCSEEIIGEDINDY